MHPSRQPDIASRPNGFTLLELLAVIGVVAVLATISLATVAKARRTARNTQCANNLRQVGLVLGQFLTENGEYPLYINSLFSQGEHTAHSGTWVGALELVINPSPTPGVRQINQGIWNCPAADQPPNFPPRRAYADFGYNARGIGTYTNGFGFGLGGRYHAEARSGYSGPPVKESDVLSPANMMALGDGLLGWGPIQQDGVAVLSRTPTAEDVAQSSKRTRQRHSGRVNVYFCDGHLEAPSLGVLFESTGDEALRRWHRDNQPHRERLAP